MWKLLLCWETQCIISAANKRIVKSVLRNVISVYQDIKFSRELICSKKEDLENVWRKEDERGGRVWRYLPIGWRERDGRRWQEMGGDGRRGRVIRRSLIERREGEGTRERVWRGSFIRWREGDERWGRVCRGKELLGEGRVCFARWCEGHS